MRVATADRDKVRTAWQNPEMLATPLLVLWLDAYVVGEDKAGQAEVLAWDPETVRLEIEDDFKVSVPQPVLDKLFAAREIVTTDRFFTSLPDFVAFCNVLSGATFDPTEFDPADAAECAWGITEALLLDPPDDATREVFAPDIVAYVGHAVAEEGILDPPDVLRLAGPPGRAARAAAAWADDPALAAEIVARDAAKGAAITRGVRDRLRLLTRQLEALSLARGDTAEIVEKLLRVVPRAAGGGPG